MNDENDLEFDEILILKEKRRTTREKGQRDYNKSKLKTIKPKKRKSKHIDYNPYDEKEDFYDYYSY